MFRPGRRPGGLPGPPQQGQLSSEALVVPPYSRQNQLLQIAQWAGSYSLLFPPQTVIGVTPAPPVPFPTGLLTQIQEQFGWPQPQWDAQRARQASINVTPVAPIPFVPTLLPQTLWPQEQWGSQEEPPLPPGTIPVAPIPFVNTALLLSMRLWDPILWSPQNINEVASFAPTGGTPPPPTTLHDYNLGLSLMTLGGFRL